MTAFSHMPFNAFTVSRQPVAYAGKSDIPVSSSQSRANQPLWDTRLYCGGLAPPPTPPPDMNEIHTSSPLDYYPQEHGYNVGGSLPAQQMRRPVVASLLQDDRMAPALSEVVTPRSASARPPPHENMIRSDFQSHRRHGSHASSKSTKNLVCPPLNCSEGNIQELAAQITCLFWFEAIETLQAIEDSMISPAPKLLTPDARPTPEFQKWVNHVLSTTRVADNVILLALLFIYRLKKQNPKVRGKPGSEYRLLTVALMLGNKFLDDNTYTNKTWAEVSFISVNEVHIMEVEFLSNMKYCLFTSAEDWLKWQTLLGKFVSFYKQANRPPPNLPVPILPPTSSLQLPRPLPSPPASTNASPPYKPTDVSLIANQVPGVTHGPTPAPSPHTFTPDKARSFGQTCSRKRSLDDRSQEPAAKRISACYPHFTSPHHNPNQTAQFNHMAPAPRLTLPTPPTSISQSSTTDIISALPSNQQLPPLNVPARAMNLVYSNGSGSGQMQALPPMAGLAAQAPAISTSQHKPRNQSSYGPSALPSPTTSLPPSATSVYPSTQLSPSYLLQQRSSPYRPVHRVSTLLYPPPTAAIQARPGDIELNQMQYQPLGKPTQHTGRLPYLAQNQWLDGTHPQDMTPVHQWPGFPIGTPASMAQIQLPVKK